MRKIRKKLYELLFQTYTKETIDEIMDTLESIAEITLKE